MYEIYLQLIELHAQIMKTQIVLVRQTELTAGLPITSQVLRLHHMLGIADLDASAILADLGKVRIGGEHNETAG